MKALGICLLALSLGSAAACSRDKNGLEIPAGSDVTLQKRDGVVVAGRLIEVKPERVVLELRDGRRTEVPRAEIASLNTTTVTTARETTSSAGTAAASNGEGAPSPASRAPDGAANADAHKPEADRAAASAARRFREVTIPSGTLLPLELRSSVSSDASKVEDQVRATLRRGVRVNGVEALPAGTTVMGVVTDVDRSARVKGRARIALRFTHLDLPGDGGRHSIRTHVVAREAAGTKKQDAAKIGAGAAGGAIVGGILGGGDGAAKGAAVGGAAGTGVVLSTRGKEVRLGPGADLAARLAAPVTVRVPLR